jgi:hypothetical protein
MIYLLVLFQVSSVVERTDYLFSLLNDLIWLIALSVVLHLNGDLRFLFIFLFLCHHSFHLINKLFHICVAANGFEVFDYPSAFWFMDIKSEFLVINLWLVEGISW